MKVSIIFIDNKISLFLKNIMGWRTVVHIVYGMNVSLLVEKDGEGNIIVGKELWVPNEHETGSYVNENYPNSSIVTDLDGYHDMENNFIFTSSSYYNALENGATFIELEHEDVDEEESEKFCENAGVWLSQSWHVLLPRQ